jgi:hypothetical protein
MVNGPRAGLAVLGTLDADDRMTRTHGWRPSAPTCWNAPATSTPPASPTSARPG